MLKKDDYDWMLHIALRFFAVVIGVYLIWSMMSDDVKTAVVIRILH